MKRSATLLSVFVLISSGSCWGKSHVSVREYRTQLGMSSSFHPARSAPILTKSGKSFSEESDLPRDLVQRRHQTSPFERLLLALNQQESPEANEEKSDDQNQDADQTISSFRQKYFNPKAARWEGYCDRWSAAAIDPEVMEILRSYPKGLICGKELFSFGELKDLLSFLYPRNNEKAEQVIGQQTTTGEVIAKENGHQIKKVEIPDFALKIRNELGIDDMDPSAMEKIVVSRLSQQQALIVELSPGSNVWNYPVFAAKISDEIFENGIPRKAMHLIPAKLFSKDGLAPAQGEIIQLLQNLESQAIKFIGPFQNNAEIESKTRQWADVSENMLNSYRDLASRNKALRPLQGNSVLQAISQTRDAIANFPPQILNALLQNIKVTRKKLTISYYRPGPVIGMILAKNYDLKKDTIRERSFEYFSFESQNGELTGRWISRASKRPDIFWIPEKMKAGLNDLESLQYSLYHDLINMIPKCQKL